MITINPYAAPGIPHLSSLTAEVILDKISVFYNLDYDIRIKPVSRKQSIVFPRQLAAYVLIHESKLSKSEIARILNQTHSNVINSIKLIENLISTNKKFKEEYNALIIKMK